MCFNSYTTAYLCYGLNNMMTCMNDCAQPWLGRLAPVSLQIGFTALKLSLDTSDSAAKEKWLDVMRKENDKMV